VNAINEHIVITIFHVPNFWYGIKEEVQVKVGGMSIRSTPMELLHSQIVRSSAGVVMKSSQ